MIEEEKEIKHKNWTLDDFRELISGGYILLFMFGGTICVMASTSLIAAFIVTDPTKVALLTKVLDTVIGFMFGAFTTMWNNQHFKEQKPTNGNPKPAEPTK